MWCFLQYATPWLIELHLICGVVCCTLPCYASLNRTCIILGCASCHVYVLCVYRVGCFFLVLLLLDSSGNVEIVRNRSTTFVRLLHGLVILPSGILGKMTVTLDLTTIFAMLVVSMLSLCRATYHLFLKPPKLP